MAHSHPLSKPLRQRFLQFLNSDINFRKKKHLQSQSAAHHGPRERGSNPSPLCDLEIFWFMGHRLVLLLCVVFFFGNIPALILIVLIFLLYLCIYLCTYGYRSYIFTHTLSFIFIYVFWCLQGSKGICFLCTHVLAIWDPCC